MRSHIVILTLLAGCMLLVDAHAQSVQRKRPAEWNGLVLGGRFMDRFLPMPVQGKLTDETWGADQVKPRYINNGLEDKEWSYWGGNAIFGNDGKYHLFVCRWREDSSRGHHEWRRSLVVHALAEKSTGPYTVKDTVGPGHNPEAFQLKDGRYVIYVMGGYYIANDLNGPWESGKFEFNKRDRRIIEGLSNLTFSRREDGSFLMVCRGGGVWFSKTGISPYHQVTDRRVYPAVEGRFEDPVVWRTHVQYHLIVNDWLGRIAYYLRSKDGIHWKVEPGEAYLPGIARYEDGTAVDWFKYERIKVLQDEYGRATQAHFAVIDVLKNLDKGSDNHSSKHICIPLTVGRLLTILDKEPITANTKSIRVKIAAEDNFNPHTDMDINSLRFGASEEVNFGRGCKVRKTERPGDDLIVTFDGTGHGITDNNFAAKLLGKTRAGKLLFGYARLPWLEYLESALSARIPKLTQKAKGFDIAVEVQNFGQVTSRPADLKITYREKNKEVEVATGTVPTLQSFEKTILKLTCGNLFEGGVAYDLNVIINPVAQKSVLLRGRVTPTPGLVSSEPAKESIAGLRRVRIVYLVSADRMEKKEYTNAIEYAIRDLQTWYAKQLGGPTFRLNDPIVEVVKSKWPANWFYDNPNGRHKDNWGFNNTLSEAKRLLGAKHNDPRFVWVIYSDGPGNKGRGGGGVTCLPEDDLLGLVGEHPTQKNKLRWIAGLGHELGHAFGLPHPKDTKKHRDAIMWTGMYNKYPDQTYLTENDKRILMRSPFFYHPNGKSVLEKGKVIARFSYHEGAFVQHAGKNPVYWTETKNDSDDEFTFMESRRDKEHIYIFDSTRGFTIRLPIHGGKSFISMDQEKTWRALYNVQK